MNEAVDANTNYIKEIRDFIKKEKDIKKVNEAIKKDKRPPIMAKDKIKKMLEMEKKYAK